MFGRYSLHFGSETGHPVTFFAVLCPSRKLAIRASGTASNYLLIIILMFKAMKSMKQKWSRGLTTLSVSRLNSSKWYDIWITNWKAFGGSGRGLIEVPIPEFVWRDWGKPKDISVRRAGVSAEIRSEHLPNTSLECYLRTDLLREKGSNQSLPPENEKRHLHASNCFC